MVATLTPGFMSTYSTFLAQILQSLPAVPLTPQAKAAASGAFAGASSFEAAKKRCRLFAGKPPAIQFCIDQARWNLKRQATPSGPKTELEQEKARCETLGKPAVVMSCKMEAPRRIAARRRAAAEAKPDRRTPLEKAVASCRLFHSKMPPMMDCIRDAKRRYGTEK